MSKHGPCLQCPEPAVAWLHFEGGVRALRLCQLDLDAWFDAADDWTAMEPRVWGWFAPPSPSHADVAAWARDPRNHRDVAAVLRAEARLSHDWLRSILDREARVQNGRLRLVLG